MRMFLYNLIDKFSGKNFDRTMSMGKTLTGNKDWFEDLRRVRITYQTPLTEQEILERAEARKFWWPNETN